MIIKHNVSFRLFAYGKNKDRYQIRLRVTFGGERKDFSTGCNIGDVKAWNAEEECVHLWYKDTQNITPVRINNRLRSIKEQAETTFKYFELEDTFPTMGQYVKEFQRRLSGTKAPKPKKESGLQKPKTPDFYEAYEEFMFECGEKNAWTNATVIQMKAILADYRTFRPDLKFSDLTEKTLTEFVVYLRSKKHLNTPRKKLGDREKYDEDDITGIRNSTIKKKLSFLNWFLRWATNKGYNQNLAFKNFRPTLKQTQKKVIYLNKDELKAVRDLVLDKSSLHLEPIRDIFLFCCFSSLRYSDAIGLKWRDVKEGHIEVTTVKTADSITIEINDMMRTILDKYRAIPSKDGHVFPSITNQAMNRELKDLCRLAGIDSEERVTVYRGTERIDQIKKKYELVGTHTGRRTFIVNALSRGIAPSVVMKWTGHSSYATMKPYIDIVDAIKAQEMSKMNFMD